jgi:cytoskeletal protein CcmA (bactofilin family)
MESKPHHDLIISGTMSASGGTFGQVKISGQASVKGDLECRTFKVAGSTDVEGHVRAEEATVKGTCWAKGDLRATRLRVDGHADVKGDLHADHLELNGVAKVGKSLTGEELEVKGALTVRENCEAEVFKIKGGFDIGGLLNAGRIEIVLYGGGKAREIGGETIEVKRQSFRFNLAQFVKSLFSIPVEQILTAETIEGDDLDLEFTKAKVVRGNNVKIGPGCEIDLVEYKNGLEISPEAKVKEQKQI